MPRLGISLLLCVSFALACGKAPGSAGEPDPCRLDAVVSVRDSVVGPFRIGEPAASVIARCPVGLDSVISDPNGSDGNRTLVVRVDGDSAYLAIASDSVFMIRVFSSRFRTAEGFGPGASVRPLLHAEGAKATRLHAPMLQVNRYCSMTFVFDRWHGDDDYATELSAGHLLVWPESPTVTEIVVSRCQGAA